AVDLFEAEEPPLDFEPVAGSHLTRPLRRLVGPRAHRIEVEGNRRHGALLTSPFLDGQSATTFSRVTSNREPLIDLLASVWASISAVCRDLDDKQWGASTDCPGWSVKDNVAHMIGTERLLLGDAPPAVDIGDSSHVRNDIGRVNEAWITQRR